MAKTFNAAILDGKLVSNTDFIFLNIDSKK